MPADSASRAPPMLRHAARGAGRGSRAQQGMRCEEGWSSRARRWKGLGLVAGWGVWHVMQRDLGPYFRELCVEFWNYLWQGSAVELADRLILCLWWGWLLQHEELEPGAKEKGFSPGVPHWVAEAFSPVNKVVAWASPVSFFPSDAISCKGNELQVFGLAL